MAHNSAAGSPPIAREARKCGWLCALEEKENDFENNPSVSATDSLNDENEVAAVNHFVEGNESFLGLWGLRMSQDNHHFHVCKCVYKGVCVCSPENKA